MASRIFGLIVIFAGCSLASAQTAFAPVSGADVSTNAGAAAMRARAPGNAIRSAIARHRAIIGERVTAAAAGKELDGTGLASGVVTGSTTGSLDLNNLLGQFLASGAISGLSGLNTGALTGGTGGFTTPGNTTNTSSNGLPPEVIQMLTEAGIDPNSVAPAGTNKTIDRSQTTTPPTTPTVQPKFAIRWANAMLSTTFTAMAIGFASGDMVEFLTRTMRPFFVPQANTDSDNGNDDDADDDDDGGSII